MQQVSANYSPYTDVRSIGISISFALIDTAASGNTTVTDNGAEQFSKVAQLIAAEVKSPGKIMTMEDDLVQTDGTWIPMPDGMIVPYWSTALSDERGSFSSPPTLTMNLSAPASSAGFTMLFDDPAKCWPGTVRITAYSGDSRLAQQEFTVTEAILVANMPVDDYDTVKVEFLNTPAPYRRIKMYQFIFGIIQEFDQSMVVTAEFEYGVSIDCSSIPSRKLTFTFDNKDKQYNFLNPTGIYKYLQNGQSVYTGISINSESVNTGQFAFQKATASDDALTAQITANDYVMRLEKDKYTGGQSGTWTLTEAVSAILGDDIQTDIPASLASVIVGKAIPADSTKREALRLVSQAAQCTCWCDRDGVFVFRDLVIGTSVDTLTSDNMYGLSGISVGEFYDCVKLTVDDSYSESDPVEYVAGSGVNVKTYSNPCAINGQQVANWLLATLQRRLQYDPSNRGNPAVEIGDTITIYNAFDAAENAVVTGQTLTYNGGLKANTKALGAAWE